MGVAEHLDAAFRAGETALYFTIPQTAVSSVINGGALFWGYFFPIYIEAALGVSLDGLKSQQTGSFMQPSRSKRASSKASSFPWAQVQ